MQQPPASPAASRLAAPGWLDGRLVLGVLLVLVSVVVGARVLSSADRSQTVWAATRDLGPGTQLVDADLTPARVRLFGAAPGYLATGGRKPTGYLLRRAVGRHELMPAAALGRPQDDTAFRAVTVAVERGHLPPTLAHGRLVDVYVTPTARNGVARAPTTPTGPVTATGSATASSTGTPAPGTGAGTGAGSGTGTGSGTGAGATPTGPQTAPRLVLAAVPVLDVPRSSGGLAGRDDAAGVVLSVRPDRVAALLGAVAEGTLDLVQVPVAGDIAPAPSPAAAG